MDGLEKIFIYEMSGDIFLHEMSGENNEDRFRP